MTELQAINIILAGSGEQVVLEVIEGAGDTANAKVILDAETRRVLAKGWSFNTEHITLQPDAEGRVPVPADVLHVDPVDHRSPYVQRGGFLYDPTQATNIIGQAVPVTVKRLLAFEEVPYEAQEFIVSLAARKYQQTYGGSSTIDRFHQERVLEAQADMNAGESDSDDLNILDNQDVAPYFRREGWTRIGRII